MGRTVIQEIKENPSDFFRILSLGLLTIGGIGMIYLGTSGKGAEISLQALGLFLLMFVGWIFNDTRIEELEKEVKEPWNVE